MTVTIIITFCTLLLLAYLFDLTSSKTRIPSVILLLILGWVVRQSTTFLGILLPDFTRILPILGTIGLILIVLEGSLEVELNRSKIGIIKKSFFGAILPMIFLAFLLGFLFSYYGQYDLKDSLLNAIPFCIISSAIAIPSIRNLTSSNKEFIIYESSLSDILGVLLFNFFAVNEIINIKSFGHFGLELLIMSVVSFIGTIGLSFLLNKIKHHVKFVPIILLVILIYALSQIYHLPGLIFILVFGLFIGNFEELKHLKWIKKFRSEELNTEVQKFKELTAEVAFLVRALFFLLFGYLLETSEILNPDTLLWAFIIVVLIFVFRIIQLKLSRLLLRPLLFIAPRGLVTILLFLSIESAHHISLVNKSLIIQVIILTSLLMMIGLMTNKTKSEITETNPPEILATTEAV